jgi:hypothetical protein
VSSLLTIRPGIYRGQVTGTESGECSARIEVRQIPGGSLAVDYEATSEREGLQHAEHTLIDERGLYVAFGEAPAIVFFEAAGDGRFVSRAPGPYAMEIHAAYADGELTWVWHWAEAGSPPREMSRAVCTRSEF